MAKIENIVFDFGGVLLDWNPRYFYRDYFRDEKEMEYFLENICNGEWNIKQDAGRPFAEGIRELVAQYPQYEKAIRLYDTGWEKMLNGEFPDTVRLLKRVKAEGYGVYGLTNWSAEKFPIARSRFACLGLFDGIVVSGEEKVAKPDPKIYEILLERYRLKAENCIFMDDNAANVAAAEALGFNAILFDDIDNVASRMAALTGNDNIKADLSTPLAMTGRVNSGRQE